VEDVRSWGESGPQFLKGGSVTDRVVLGCKVPRPILGFDAFHPLERLPDLHLLPWKIAQWWIVLVGLGRGHGDNDPSLLRSCARGFQGLASFGMLSAWLQSERRVRGPRPRARGGEVSRPDLQGLVADDGDARVEGDEPSER
jgi:hypothetical protein